MKHRFTGAASADWAAAGLEDASMLTPVDLKPVAKFAGRVASMGLDVMKSAVGHYLHEFLDDAGVCEARRIYDRIGSKLEPESKSSTLTVDEKWLVVLLFVESQKITDQNAKSDSETGNRIAAEAEYLKHLQGTAEKRRSWWSSFFGKGHTKIAVKEINIQEDAGEEVIQVLKETNINDLVDEIRVENLNLNPPPQSETKKANLTQPSIRLEHLNSNPPPQSETKKSELIFAPRERTRLARPFIVRKVRPRDSPDPILRNIVGSPNI